MSPGQDTASQQPKRRGPMPLAAQLSIMLTVLAFLVLVMAGIALTTLLNSFLLTRLDDQLLQTAQVAESLLGPDADDAPGSEPSHEGSAGAPQDSVRQSDSLPAGTVAAVVSATHGNVIVTGPKAPAVSAAQLVDIARSAPGSGGPFSNEVGDEDYRWLVAATDDRATMIGVPLDPVEQTVQRLVALLGIVGVVALIGVAGGGFLVVRRGLRPLGRLADGARAIATSDLGAPTEPGRHRMAMTAEKSSAEVAELSGALATMLDEIDQSIVARDVANERLRRFVADASHELRSPLASIRAYSELLRRGVLSDQAQSQLFLRRIESESIRLGTLVNDLLLLAQLDQGRQLAREPVDAVSIIDEAVGDLRAADPGRQVEVMIAEGASPIIPGDLDRLRQVFSNLLANVRVHTPTATAVTISVQVIDQNLVVDIADHGPGIPADALDSIFDRFVRVDAGRSREKGGSGLGLAITRSVVAAHGGSVDLTSSSAGTTVRICLPTT